MNFQIGVALRSELYEPGHIRELLPEIERSNFSSIWYPDVSGYDSLDLVVYTLGKTSAPKVCTGVLRVLEWEKNQLLRRLRVVASLGDGRFVLGVGSGSERGGATISELLSRAEWLVSQLPPDNRPQLYYAALRREMFKKGLEKGNGVLLNFFTREHLRGLLSAVGAVQPTKTVAGYLRVFFASDRTFAAGRMIEEFSRYNRIPAYASLFRDEGLDSSLQLGENAKLEKERLNMLGRVALLNPTQDELMAAIRGLRDAGLNLPVIYPMIYGSSDFRLKCIRELSGSIGAL